MPKSGVQRWLEAWGYDKAPKALHLPGEPVPASHPYQAELEALIRRDGDIGAAAVFDVEHVPTVCFLEGRGLLADESHLDQLREKIWNQNLVTVVVVVHGNQAKAVPVVPRHPEAKSFRVSEAQSFGPLSRADIESGELFLRQRDWFRHNDRVDQTLLRNLGAAVEYLSREGLGRLDAQFLMAQVLFVRYLEDRGIIGDQYRRKRRVEPLETLVEQHDRDGITRLLGRLDQDFNGDFLKPDPGTKAAWKSVSDAGLDKLAQFLRRAELADGQESLFGYDFSYLPVELISGIYESFLNEDKSKTGAYYTPRNLASLVVDKALSESDDPLSEVIYDGACGSGILLTTAFRRLLSFAEERKGRRLAFSERIRLLRDRIRGSDISESAIKVTAFSLYLALLEDLEPRDVVQLVEDSKERLPNLRDELLFAGLEKGEFFSPKNPLVARRECTLFVSNPPWVEPGGSDRLPSDDWAESQRLSLPRRQVAAGFAHRAYDCLNEEGRVALILPVSLFAAPTSQKFVRQWLERFSPRTLINFGDLRKLLFSTARSPCMVATAKRRLQKETGRVPGSESFEYWTPKADLSFAFGRLTLRPSDKCTVTTRQLASDNSLLTTLFWGTDFDWSLIDELRAKGTIGDLIGEDRRWSFLKGFHAQDRNVARPVSSGPLRTRPFLDAKALPTDSVVLGKDVLQPFPKEIRSVAKLRKELLRAFAGPRIVFKDGLSRDRAVCAVFGDQDFSFKSSLGVITGPNSDADLLRFAAAYLHSDLVRYCLLLGAWQVAFERERVTLADTKRLPFILPENHSEPRRAKEIVREVAALTKRPEEFLRSLRESRSWEDRLNELVAEYFSLSASQRTRVRDVAKYLIPSVQPGALDQLSTPAQQRADAPTLRNYIKALKRELNSWQRALGGEGKLQLSGTVSRKRSHGPLGVVEIELSTEDERQSRPKVVESDEVIQGVLAKLWDSNLFPLKRLENLYFAANVCVFFENSLYLVKPLIQREWLESQAQPDAARAVAEIQRVVYTKPKGKAS